MLSISLLGRTAQYSQSSICEFTLRQRTISS